jgi:Cd2+/Zn2+-exporting ATPase
MQQTLERLPHETLEVRVGGLDCEHDAAAIRRGLKDTPGLEALEVFPKSARVRLVYDPGRTTEERLLERLSALGFVPVKGPAAPVVPGPWRNPKVLLSLLSGGLLLAGWLAGFTDAPSLVTQALYAASLLSGGYFFGREAVEDLIFERRVGIELLMAVAAVVAAVMGALAEGAMLAFLYSISEAAEGYTEERTRSAVRALMDLAPKTAHVLRDGREVETPVEDIAAGDVLLVRPGETVPTDGRVAAGRSSVDEAPVTGESVPVEKGPGDAVYAGSINGEGALEVEATKVFADNTIARIIRMVEEAQERKGRSERFIERFGRRYSPAVLALGVLIAVGPPLLAAASWSVWILRATVFIVAAAPCALVISIPIAMAATLGRAARDGVLIKGGIYVEELAKVRVVAFDKTGTLTTGEPEVTDVRPWTSHAERETLALAAAVERQSEHPLARAVVRRAEEEGIAPVPVEDFRALTGAGATARVDGRRVFVGSPALFAERLGRDLSGAEPEIRRLQEEGKTVVLVGTETELYGLIALRDNLRPDAPRVVGELRRQGLRVAMLTGDNRRTAGALARELGLDEVYAGLKPDEKALQVRRLHERYGHVAMVGDGVNDAPALAEATVGVAMGAIGTDVAMETADVVLMADDLEKLVYALALARKNGRVVRQNLWLSAVVIGALVVGAVAGAFTLPVAVVGHELSEFAVIGSGLRMLRA